MPHPPIAQLLRHEPPMSVLDGVLHADGLQVSCTAHVTESCPFLRDSVLPAVALLEYMAQAIGVYVTLERQRTEGGPPQPRVGYLIGARDVEFHIAELPLGTRFEVHARLDWHDATVARFSCRVERERDCLARGHLTVYEPEREAS